VTLHILETDFLIFPGVGENGVFGDTIFGYSAIFGVHEHGPALILNKLLNFQLGGVKEPHNDAKFGLWPSWAFLYQIVWYSAGECGS
jgi:hypothetical protein